MKKYSKENKLFMQGFGGLQERQFPKRSFSYFNYSPVKLLHLLAK